MARQDVTFELQYDDGGGVDWVEQTNPLNPAAQAVFARQPVTMKRGAGAEGQPAPPSTAAAQFDDRSGKYNPANAESPLFGQVGRNTPFRIRIGGTARCTTEAAWSPEKPIGGAAFTAVDGAGVLSRLGIGKTPVRSPAYRTLTTPDSVTDMIGYWPLEEQSLADALDAYLPDTPITTSGTIEFGRYTNHPATARMLTFGAAGQLVATPAAHTATGEYKVIGLWNIPTTVATDSVLYRLLLTGGNLGRIEITTNDSIGPPFECITAWLYNTAGVLVDANTVDLAGQLWGHDAMLALHFSQAANITVDVSIVTQTGGILTALGVGTGRTMGTLTGVITAASDLSGCSFGHLALATDVGAFADFLSPNADDVLGCQAFLGEHAGFRFLRLCEENGVSGTLVGDIDDTWFMGPQPVDTLVKLLQQCVDTDDGLMYEPADQLGVVMATGRSRYNQDAALELDITDRGVSAPLPLKIDNQRAYNDVTVQRYRGSSYRAVLETGSMSTQDPPVGIGVADRRFDVNTSSDRVLIDHAYWHLAQGTVDEPRWPQVTVDLDAAPELVSAVEAVDIGSVILGRLAHWPCDPSLLLVLGIQETVRPRRRLVTFVCVPASVFEIGIVGADDGSSDLRGQAIGSGASSLASALTTTTGTTLSVASTSGLWTTDPDDWSTSLNGVSPHGYGGGLFLTVGGETMRVTNITGASSPQTFTVVRSVNGVRKTHAAGTPVEVLYPVRVGL